jgi:DNA-binding beta-propeller fold protein YncE
MKPNDFLKATSRALFVVVLTLAACQAWAATPLNSPAGLALDSKGYLYVANSNANQILVYSPNAVQQPRKTITAGLSSPISLAFDSKGNLYVANIGNNSVTVYDSTGKQKTGSTITKDVYYPIRIIIDSLDDVWVDNAADSISIYSTSGTEINYTVPPAYAPEGIATNGAYYVVGTFNHWNQYPAGEYLTKGEAASYVTYHSAGIVYDAEFDSKGNYWLRQDSGEVDVVNPNTNIATEVIPPGGTPSYGMAIDSRRNRIYLTSTAANAIDVFTTAGAYMYTIF